MTVQSDTTNTTEDNADNKMHWCFTPVNTISVSTLSGGDIVLPEAGEVDIGRSMFGLNDRKISRNHLSIRVQENRIFIKLLHHNPCHYRRKNETIFQDIPTSKYIALYDGDHLILMWTYEYEVGYKPAASITQPTIRQRSCTALTAYTESTLRRDTNMSDTQTERLLHPVLNNVNNGWKPDKIADEEVDDKLPPGDLNSHMSWRDPDKDVPGPDRYHQDWLIVSVNDEIKDIQATDQEECDDNSLFSNHSEEKHSVHKSIYEQNNPPKSNNIFRNLCGKAPVNSW